MTNSLFAVRRVRNVGLTLAGLLLCFPFVGLAQDPPKGGQEGPPKGQQKGDKEGAPKEDETKKQKAADEALKKVKEEARKESGEAPQVKSVEMEKSGAARKRAEDIRNVQRVPVPQPGRADATAVTTGKGDKAQVRRWARYQLSLFTDPDQDKFVQKNHEDVLRPFEQLSDQDYLAALKQELITNADVFINETEEPKISTAAKVNMISLLDELDGKRAGHELNGAKVNNVNVLLKTLRNHQRHGDGVLYATLNGLINAKARNLTTVESERQAAKALMQIARRGELQPLFLEMLCKTLGVIEMPFEGLVNEAVEVATFLANIATNETLAERTRFEAAIALGRLKKQNLVMNYAFDVEAWVFAKTYQGYLNWVIASRAADPPKVGANVIRHLGVRMYDAMRRSAEQAAGSPGQERLRSLLTTVEPSLKDILDANRDQPPDVEAINEWVKANAVQPLRLARRAQEIRPVVKPAAAPQNQPAGGAAAADR